MPHANDPPPVRTDVPVNIGLGVVFGLGIAFTAYMIATSWGGAYPVPTTAVAVVMCGLALLRGRFGAWPAAAGAAVAAAATVVSSAAGLPREPSPVAALALAVLVGSALRTLPARSAVAVAAGGIGAVGLGWSGGPAAVPVLATVLVTCGLVVGTLLRAFAPVRRSGGEPRPGRPSIP
ncbi:metal transporter [Actinomadura algeriensis]|uniref:Metal transporter n=1 Tax=Actinomadura algeriensis TaxID=1679523 RepID=A0ABR9JRG7_9ACTN|nr:metal transporter [Actinomadura algeriensis]MBE1533171.1 hypothetical protein [Actinomadura algeriensis]